MIKFIDIVIIFVFNKGNSKDAHMNKMRIKMGNCAIIVKMRI